MMTMNNMNKIRWYPVIVVLCFVCVQCSKYDEYKKYMPNGEIIYPQKPSSVKTYPGKNRVQLEWVIVDPKVTSCKIAYKQENIQKDTTVVIPERGTGSNDTIRVIVPDLKETAYVFEIVSYDDFGNVSIPVEVEEEVYGEIYETTLSNRLLKDYSYDKENGLQLEWYDADETEIGMELYYTDINGNNQMILVAGSETSTTISDYKYGEPLFNISLYKPVPSAIDTFYTEKQRVIMQTTINAALNKTVTSSSDYNAAYAAVKAVDGDRSDTASRWLTANNVFSEHWIEIDMESPQTISALGLWRQVMTTGQTMWKWKFQAWIDDDWVTVIEEDNAPAVGTNPHEYYKKFDPVTTSKVRWYLPEYDNNMVRLYEIEVYCEVEL
jgi:hypothetical protein